MLNGSINLNSSIPDRSTTPTKVNFNYVTGQPYPQLNSINSQPIQYVPINQGIGTNQNVIIKKTVVPMHYYN